MSLQKTDLNVAPFYDDYDESKGFHRVLFRPTKSVQARELTQAQTILQEQINRFGRHFFQEGSVVVPGGINAIPAKDTIAVSLGGNIDPNVLTLNKDKLYIVSTSSGVEAHMVKFVPAANGDPTAFALDYRKTATDGVTRTFQAGETCNLVIRDDSGDTIVINMVVNSVQKGTYVAVLPGVYFVRGHMVRCESQDIVATPFRNDQNVHVGFKINESIISETQDASLLSNALGAPNYKAPGAARLKIELTLASYIGDYNDNSFVEIVTFANGELQNKVVSTDYSYLMNNIAQRQYETNGNFTVAPIPLNIYDHMRNEDFKDGLYTPALGGDATKLVYRLGRGIAYTNGFRSEIQNYYDIVADKAIDTNTLRNAVLPTSFGSYFLCTTATAVSLPPLDLKKRVNLLDGSNAVIGTCLVRSVKYNGYDAIIAGNTIRLYVMDVRFNTGKSLADLASVKYQDSSNNFSAPVYGKRVYDSTVDSMLFKLPYDAVKSLSTQSGINTSYSVVRSYDITLNGSGVGSVSLPANEYFVALNGFDYAAALTGSGTPGTAFGTDKLALGGTGGNKTLTVNVGASYSGQVVRVIAPVYKAVTGHKTKTLTSRTQTIAFANQSSAILDRCDVYKLDSVILVNPDLTEVDVSNQFGINSGSKPNWYENGSLYKLDSTKVTGNYRVTYEYFNHSSGDYFTVDSYGGMLREDIPLTSDTFDKTVVSLADCLDFRPLRDASTATGSVIGDFTSASWLGDLIDPNDSVNYDVTYYTNRMDLVFAAPDGSFSAMRGIPGDNPSPPPVPNDCMALYQVYIPAYTVDVSKVRLFSFDNKRYTMRDIGKLEGRIGNLEYYTSLNLLENKVERTQVLDQNGLNRFKNGFSADNFLSTTLGDVTDPLWAASYDLKNGLLLGSYKESPADMIYKSGTNHKIGRSAVMDFTTSVAIKQPLATQTINVNPYAVYTWSGSVELFPASDFWKDTVYLPPITRSANGRVTSSGNSSGPSASAIQDYNDQYLYLKATPETMQKIWGSDSSIQTPGALLTWQTQSGTVVTIPNTTIPGSSVGGLPVPTWAITPYTLADVPGFTPGTTLAGFPLPPAGIPIWSPSAPTQGNSVRWGVTGSHVETTVTNQYFDDLIATAVIPWMRSIQITARLKGFRPFTKLFAFFNGISVDAYIQQTKPALGTLGANIVVDDTGAAEAVFTIPSDVNMRFPVGDATLRFTDDPVNGATNAQSFTSGETVFKSGGTLETRQQTTVTTVTQTVVEDWGWVSPPRDPVAQTFYVSDSGGIWVPKIDVAFSTKAKKLPITLQVRSVTAGLPTNVVAAGGQVILDPSQVNVSADGSVMTSFVFDDPIYLAGKTEYAIVLLADTQEYNVFIATMGQRVIGKNLNVAEQPNIGVFLTSSNASTWSPDQLSDLTFAVHKCVFDTNTTTQVVWECFRPMAQITTLHPITTTSGSNIVKLNVRSHSLKAGDTFPIYVAEDGAGIPSTEFIGTKTVLSSGLDWVTFAVTTNANASTNVGGVVSLTANYPVTEFRPDIIQNTLPGTTVAWEYQYVSQASRATSAWTLFTNTNETNGLPSEGVIRQDGDFKIRATFKTTDPNLTPQVKLNGMGVQLIGRRLTNDATNPAFNYVTKAVKFDNANTSMRAYIGVNLPGSTNMKAYYKLLATGSDDLSKVAWTEVLPQTSIINQQKGFVEYEYRVNSTTPFVGYKMMICFFGPDPVDCPIVQDFRSIALA